jgi:PAS domain S-box-containing protein
MKTRWRWPWTSLSLRQTLFLGAGVGILLPAMVLTYFQISDKLENEINLRVRAPMEQYSDVLARGLAVAIWNVDRSVAAELVDAVMRNPDLVSITVNDEYKEVFVHKQNDKFLGKSTLSEARDVYYNGSRVGRLEVVLTTSRIEQELRNDFLKLIAALVAQVCISFLFIWLLFDRRLMRPLRELEEGAQRLARGELDQPLRWGRHDEIGGLARGLDKMRADLGTLLTERDQKNAALEHELEERQRTEQALGFSQAKFSAIFDASPVAMTVSKVGGNFQLMDLNAAWSRLFVRERNVVLNTSGETNGVWKQQIDRHAFLSELARTGEVSRRPIWMCRGGGHPDILCEVSGKIISLGNETLMILAFEDITEKHHYEANILSLNATLERRVGERTQELSDALGRLTAAQTELVRTEKMAALGSLVAGIAHELNTPIGNSLTVASTMQDQSREFSNSMAQGLTRSRLSEYLAATTEGAGILMRSLHHAANLVSSFKQVAVDQTSVNRRRFDLHDTVDEILLTMGPALRKTTHTVERNIPHNISLESYPGPLGQVVTNLINNALVHGLEGREHGKVLVSARMLEDKQVEIVVSDNGIGIPEANLARVFDPFFTTKLGKGGSGLGLHIVYNLAHDALGGTIALESTVGHGACFTLTVPLIAPAVTDSA